jgi:nicotinamide riboside transporter PnuC
MFASKTIAAHLLRGVIAVALIAWALLHQSPNPAIAVAAGVAAVAAMKGCPMCWTIGLLETIGERIKVR